MDPFCSYLISCLPGAFFTYFIIIIIIIIIITIIFIIISFLSLAL